MAATTPMIFLSTPSARRATGAGLVLLFRDLISIHALREEGDTGTTAGSPWLITFLSTPSARRATRPAAICGTPSQNFYPRPPRGGRLSPPSRPATTGHISIHALREEGDGRASKNPPTGGDFYPRPPRGGRPMGRTTNIHIISISIHALREEGDRVLWRAGSDRLSFLSTPSARRATTADGRCQPVMDISIHALREEGDRSVFLPRSACQNFYPRPPRGGRRHPYYTEMNPKS